MDQIVMMYNCIIVVFVMFIAYLLYLLNKSLKLLNKKVEEPEVEFEEPVVNITVDSLNAFFDLQRKVQNMLNYDFSSMSLEEKETYTKDMVLYLLEEAHELLRETNFKSHKKVKKPINIDNIKDELVDILHFYVNLCLVWNVSPEEITSTFIEKNAKNVKRIESENY